MFINRKQVEQNLRALLGAGVPLGEALQTLQREHTGHGLMELWPAVMNIQQISKREAMKIVVHETAPWRT